MTLPKVVGYKITGQLDPKVKDYSTYILSYKNKENIALNQPRLRSEMDVQSLVLIKPFYLSICLLIYLSFYLFSLHLSFYLHIFLSICLSISPPIFLFLYSSWSWLIFYIGLGRMSCHFDFHYPAGYRVLKLSGRISGNIICYIILTRKIPFNKNNFMNKTLFCYYNIRLSGIRNPAKP